MKIKKDRERSITRYENENLGDVVVLRLVSLTFIIYYQSKMILGFL